MHNATVGEALGDTDGLSVGDVLGANDGDALGAGDGLVLGDELGAKVVHAPSVVGSKGEHNSSGLAHSLLPSQAESRQQPSSKPHVPAQNGPPPSTHVSVGSL